MEYLNNRITRTEFVKTRGSLRTQQNANTCLNLFDFFCKGMYQKNGDNVILDMENAIKQDTNYDRLFRLCNSFVLWLQEDQPDCIVKKRHFSTFIKKHNPSSIKRVITILRQYLEEFGHIEFSERKFRRMVRLPKELEEDPESFKKEEIRAFVDNARPQRKALYMTLKDSGMRIGEAVQLKKRDIDLTTNPVTITIPANYTKTKKGRITFVTRETKPYLKRLLDTKQDDDLVFGASQDYKQSVVNEEVLFMRLRKNLGFTERYESNNRHKKNMHSLRAFCATQLSELYGEEFGHGFIGHKKYLSQYIRNKEKLAEKYLRAENYLMIYQTVEVVDQSSELSELRNEIGRIKRDSESFKKLTEEKTRLEIEIENQRKELLLARQRS